MAFSCGDGYAHRWECHLMMMMMMWKQCRYFGENPEPLITQCSHDHRVAPLQKPAWCIHLTDSNSPMWPTDKTHIQNNKGSMHFALLSAMCDNNYRPWGSWIRWIAEKLKLSGFSFFLCFCRQTCNSVLGSMRQVEALGSFVCPSIHLTVCYYTCVHDILKMN